MNNRILPTFSGKLFNLESPTIESISIEDIAHHLSIENRYNGATKFPYSVAYHSLLVCQFAPAELKLEALLHDAEETYYKDLPSPWKKVLIENIGTNLLDYTVHWTKGLIINKFKLSHHCEDWKIIKQIDLSLATTEIAQLINGFSEENWQHEYKGHEGFNVQILERNWRNVEIQFLSEFEKWRRN